MTVRLNDSANVSKAYVNDDGYLVAKVKIARSGIYQYSKRELGFMEDGIVNVYRPDDEVFNRDSLKSLAHAAVTVGHPDQPVTADNWSELAVGEVSTEVLRDGEWLTTSIIVKDSKAQRQSARELSAGYNCNIVAEDGVAPCGTKYQFKQTDIKFNHLAIVPQGRAGHEARIGDGALNWGASPKQQEVPEMELKTVVLGDAAVQVIASDEAKIAEFKTSMTAKLSDAETKVGELTAKLADAESKVISDSDIDARVEAKMQLLYLARQVFDKLITDGKSDIQIKREVVAHKFGDAVTSDASDAHIEGMFKVATSDAAQVNDTARLALAADAKPIDDYAKRISDAQAKFYKGEK